MKLNPKSVVRTALLIFVVVSVVVAVYTEIREGSEQPSSGRLHGNANASRAKLPENRVVVYYFHGNARCTTCRKIESYAREAVESEFQNALETGRLEWRTVNVDQPANNHYVQDFELSTRSVVLELIKEGRRTKWTNLDRVWELVRREKEDYLRYVRFETEKFLEKLNQ